MDIISCVIFDMDGVIVNTEPLHKKAYFKTFKFLDLDVSDELYHSLTGSSTINAFQKLINHFDLHLNPEELVLQKRAYFNELFITDSDLQLIEGVEDIIKYFYNNGTTLVLASSASNGTINRVFERFDLNKYFIGKLSGADLKESKPHPEIFENAAKLANTPKNKCIVIEDSDNGVIAANRAGIFCVGYRSEHSKMQTLATADMVIESFEELKKLPI
ncbi:MAG: ABC transporter ATP-binding protein [Lutibacter sp.]|nr:MAG: ABC transporter ATP-binding protein [Lutibacter sp.]